MLLFFYLFQYRENTVHLDKSFDNYQRENLSMQGQKALRFNQKHLNLCSEDEQKCDWFGMKWGWVINDRIFILGQTIPINKRATFLFYTYNVFRSDDFVVECFLGQSTENLFNKVQEKK